MFSVVRRPCAVFGLLALMLAGCDPKPTVDETEDTPPEPPTPPDIRIVQGPALSASPLLSDQARALPPSGSKVPAGLVGQEWTVAEYGNPAQLLVVPQSTHEAPSLENHTRLAVELFGGPAYSTALCLEGTWRLSIAGEAETVLVIYNATPAAMQGGIAYTLSASYLWYESRPFVLKPGWNTIRIRQGSAEFKTPSSNWQHTAGLWRPEDCRGIALLFHNGRRTGRLFIDHIGVSERPADPSNGSPSRAPVQSPK